MIESKEAAERALEIDRIWLNKSCFGIITTGLEDPDGL